MEFLRPCGRPCAIQFALASFYADCLHKRIIMNAYMEKNNVQVDINTIP